MDRRGGREVLIETEHLSVRFPLKKETPFSKRRYINAVSDVSIEIFRGETFALVGESGCGKSTLADATLGFVSPSGGEIRFLGERLDRTNKKRLRAQRELMQKVFQDPSSSLDPRFTVRQAVSEPLVLQKKLTDEQIDEETESIVKSVGLPKEDLDRFVTEFSGGQQQRIAIARALVAGAEYIVCDEPVSALDVSVHAQILNLLMDIQRERGITYLFISHNLASVRKLADRIAIMYLGRIVEYGDADKIFARPLHPYTRALIASVLSIDGEGAEEAAIEGDAQSTTAVDGGGNGEGCGFMPRCPMKRPECVGASCVLREAEPGHFTACEMLTADTAVKSHEIKKG